MVDKVTDYQCPVCFTFYDNGKQLLDHFNNDFPLQKDDKSVEYGLQKTMVLMCYNLRKKGLWDQVVTGSLGSAGI